MVSKELPINNYTNDVPKADVYIKPSINPKSYSGDYGEKALNNWSIKMNERKNTQQSLSSEHKNHFFFVSFILSLRNKTDFCFKIKRANSSSG